MAGDISPYLSLLASQHKGQPNYTAFISIFLQGQADTKAVAQSLPSVFDLDNAIGAQLDIVGLWIGRTRYVYQAITGVYFSWDTTGVGWDQGIWYDGSNPQGSIVELPDAQYRTLLQVTAAANEWDGTIPGSYAIWNPVFNPLGFHIEITDHQNMTMDYHLVGTKPDALTYAMYQNGYFDLRPAGVSIANHY